MKKIMILLVLMAVIATAVFADFSEWGYSQSNSFAVQGQSAMTDIYVNHTVSDFQYTSPIIDDLDADGEKEIVRLDNNILQVYNYTGGLLAQVVNSDLGSRQLATYTSTTCASGTGIFALGYNGIYEYCFDGSSISLEDNSTITGSHYTDTRQGMTMFTYSGNPTGFFQYFGTDENDTGVGRCQFTDPMVCNYQAYAGLNDNFYDIPMGDLDGDSNMDFVFPYVNHDEKIVVIEDNFNTWFINTTRYDEYDDGFFEMMIVERASPNFDWVAVPRKDYSGSSSRAWSIVDFQGDEKFILSYGGYSSRYTSNLVQLGEDGDICYNHYQNNGFFSTGASLFECYDLLGVATISTNNGGFGSNRGSEMMAVDVGHPIFVMYDGYASGTDAEICQESGSDVDYTECFNFGGDQISAVAIDDLNGDGKMDFVMHRITEDDMQIMLSYTTGTGIPPSTSCSLPDCDYPCIAYDDFSYDCSLEDMGWTLYPSNPSLVPESGRMCYDATGVHYSQWLLDAYADEQVLTTEFDLQIDDGVTPIHEFVWYDGTDDQYMTTYYIWWEEYNGTNYLYAHDENGSSYELCQDCWTLGQEHHYKIGQYHQDTDGDVFYNVTSGNLEPIDQNTFYVIIDDNTSLSFFNLPQKEPLVNNHSNLLNDATFRWYDEKVCVDDFQVYAGTEFATGEFTPDCTYHPVSYSYPTLWADYFQYNDEITDFGWDGYPFVIGDNPYDTCDILYYDMDDYEGAIGYDMDSAIYDDFKIAFDLMPDSSLNSTSYSPCGMPMNFYAFDNQDNLVFFATWAQTGQDANGYCNITTIGNYTFPNIGKWDGGALNSYIFDVDWENKTYDFYYTTQDDPLTYTLGGDDIGLYNQTSNNIKRFEWRPTTPRISTQNGFWLDTIRVTSLAVAPEQNITNFCYFDGCLFHDHFDYTDAIENHGWYFFNNTPQDSIVTLSDNPYGYFTDHDFDIFRETTQDGILTVQTRMLIEPHDATATNKPKFYLISGDLQSEPLNILFDSGTIYDTSTTPFIALGSYQDNKWYTFSWVVDLTTDEYDFYIDSSKVVDDQTIRDTAPSVGSVGWHTIDNPIQVDYITVAVGTELVEDYDDVTDSGVPSEHLKKCWDDGDFDWGCCSEEEEEEKSWGCVTRVTFFYWMGSLTSFILQYILYFIVLAILFVILMPFIVPAIRRR